MGQCRIRQADGGLEQDAPRVMFVEPEPALTRVRLWEEVGGGLSCVLKFQPGLECSSRIRSDRRHGSGPESWSLCSP